MGLDMKSGVSFMDPEVFKDRTVNLICPVDIGAVAYAAHPSPPPAMSPPPPPSPVAEGGARCQLKLEADLSLATRMGMEVFKAQLEKDLATALQVPVARVVVVSVQAGSLVVEVDLLPDPSSAADGSSSAPPSPSMLLSQLSQLVANPDSSLYAGNLTSLVESTAGVVQVREDGVMLQVQAAPTATPAPPAAAASSSATLSSDEDKDKDKDTALPGWTVALIAIFALLFVIALAFVVFMAMREKQGKPIFYTLKEIPVKGDGPQSVPLGVVRQMKPKKSQKPQNGGGQKYIPKLKVVNFDSVVPSTS